MVTHRVAASTYETQVAKARGRNAMRLSYSLPSADKITEGVALLAGVISRA